MAGYHMSSSNRLRRNRNDFGSDKLTVKFDTMSRAPVSVLPGLDWTGDSQLLTSKINLAVQYSTVRGLMYSNYDIMMKISFWILE